MDIAAKFALASIVVTILTCMLFKGAKINEPLEDDH